MSLIVAEHEDLVLSDRSTDRTTKLVEDQRCLSVETLKTSVEHFVPVVFKQAPMPLVGAGLRDDIYLPPDGIFILGRNHALDLSHFLNTLCAHDVDQVGCLVCSGTARPCMSARTGSVERPLCTVCPDAIHIDALSASSAGHNAGIQQQDTRDIAILQRQLPDLSGLESMKLFGGHGVDKRSHAFDVDGLGDGT